MAAGKSTAERFFFFFAECLNSEWSLDEKPNSRALLVVFALVLLVKLILFTASFRSITPIPASPANKTVGKPKSL